MSSKYNTAQAVILIVGFTSYMLAHFIGAIDLNISFTMAFILLNAGLQSLASWNFNNQYAKAQDLATSLKHARKAEILKLERNTGNILLAFSSFYLFLLEACIILNIFDI